MRPALAVTLNLLLIPGLLSAASSAELKRDCAAFRSDKNFANFKTCAGDVFTAKPLHPIVRSIVPGGGTGVGLNYTLDSPKGMWQRSFTVNGATSFRNYWLAETKVTLTHPKFGDWNTARDAFATHFYVRARGLPRMPFYGLGPHTSQAGLVDFSENDTFIGADAVNPLASWIGVGGTVEGILPDVNGVHKPTVRSIDQYYTEATAPGLLKQPAFLHSEVFLHPHHADPFEFDYHIGYNFFHDMDTGHYSFRRFRADLRHNIYPERSNGQPHRDSVISIRGVVSLSDKSSGAVIPFYLQETLGGSDINGDPVLRGFRDYRFRGPDLLLVQTQYERRIWNVFGILAFYDAGKVANRKADINFADLRHSFGGGMDIWMGAKVVFRAYVGLGSGEGAHPFFGIPTGLF
jgi:hypothetical protein